MNANPSTRDLLLFPGERLGWVFRDRNLFRRRFPEPPPVLQPVPQDLVTAAYRSSQVFGRRLGWSIGGTVIALMLVGCCTSIGAAASSQGALLSAGALAFVGLVGAASIGAVVFVHQQTRAAVGRAEARNRTDYEQLLAGWQRRKAEFDRTEQENCDRLMEWGAAALGPGTRRIDIIGGNLWGWEAFLTVFGGSMLRSRGPMTVVDLSGEGVCRELIEVVASSVAGFTTDVQVLPRGLATSDLLVGLDSRQLIDALIESLYGDSDGPERTSRTMDDRILTSVCNVLGTDLSMARLAAALRLLMGEPDRSAVLTADERSAFIDDLFGDSYRREALSHLRRIEAFIHPLEQLGADAQPRQPAQLSCLAVLSDGRNARGDLLQDLIVQWLMRRVASSSDHLRTLVIAGADELQRRHLERLSDICERRNVRLCLMFRHLRESSLQVLGAGAVGFMKLGSHEEATRAADFIGRHHKFVLSQLTQTVGGNETRSSSEGEGVSDGVGGDWGWFFRHTKSWNSGRSWNKTASYAHGTNWSDAATRQRVYEYAVEPRTVQDLPDYAMLLVESHTTGPVLTAVDCNPEIITLPRATIEPLPQLSLPAQPAINGQLPVQQMNVSGFQHTAPANPPVSSHRHISAEPRQYPPYRPAHRR
jgi:hypothetical protein